MDLGLADGLSLFLSPAGRAVSMEVIVG